MAIFGPGEIPQTDRKRSTFMLSASLVVMRSSKSQVVVKQLGKLNHLCRAKSIYTCYSRHPSPEEEKLPAQWGTLGVGDWPAFRNAFISPWRRSHPKGVALRRKVPNWAFDRFRIYSPGVRGTARCNLCDLHDICGRSYPGRLEMGFKMR